MSKTKRHILCRLGLHKPDRNNMVSRMNRKGRHKWRTNHIACKRCGKLLYRVTWDSRSPKGAITLTRAELDALNDYSQKIKMMQGDGE